MPARHLFLALLVIVIWGLNFIFVKLSLNEITPLWLCAIRFFLASVPAVFFIKPPAAPFKWVILYGFLMFGLQFSLLFIGMNLGMPPGLASILLQVQVFFSIFIAGVFLGEFPTFWQILGALVSFTGIGVVAFHLDHNATLGGFLLIMGGAMAWGFGNLVTKKIGHVNMMALVVWGSLVACPPLVLLSLIFEGPQALVHTYHDISWVGIGSVLYIVYLSTWAGYGLWNWMIRHYSVASVAPFTLLVPFVAMFASVVFLHESFAMWKLEAGLLVIIGLCINFLAPRVIMMRRKFGLKKSYVSNS